MVVEIYRDHWGIKLPPMVVDPDNLRQVMRAIKKQDGLGSIIEPVDSPEHGDIVTLAYHNEPAHVGVWLEYNGGRVIHCARKGGITIMDSVTLNMYGYYNPEYHRYYGPVTASQS